VSRHPAATTRSLILDEAVRCFAEWGYEGTPLNDIAAGVGIRRPSLLHHFPSKEVLYQEVFERLLSDWLERVESAAAVDHRGWAKVEAVLRAGFDYFADNPDYVRLVRRAAIDGGNHLVIDLAGVLRPMFDRAAEYFEREMTAGTFAQHDARHLMISGYGALLSYFSDAALLEGLLDSDPFSSDELKRRADHVIDLFASALGVRQVP
jgi:AcrR family transcriptional regulator